MDFHPQCVRSDPRRKVAGIYRNRYLSEVGSRGVKKDLKGGAWLWGLTQRLFNVQKRRSKSGGEDVTLIASNVRLDESNNATDVTRHKREATAYTVAVSTVRTLRRYADESGRRSISETSLCAGRPRAPL